MTKKGELTGELGIWKEYIQKCFRSVLILLFSHPEGALLKNLSWKKLKQNEKFWKMEVSAIFMSNVNLHQQKSEQGTGAFSPERPILSSLHCSTVLLATLYILLLCLQYIDVVLLS